MKTEEKLKSLNIELPKFNNPAGNYVTYKKVGNLVFVSGQTTRINGEIKFAGKMGSDLTLDQGREAAKVCILNVLCQLKAACGDDLDNVSNVARIGVFVLSSDNFKEHAKIADAASDLLVAIFGDKGKHTRTSVGCNSLPSNSTIEIEGVFEVK